MKGVKGQGHVGQTRGTERGVVTEGMQRGVGNKG